MTMEALYTRLSDAIVKGHLENIYSDDNMSIFCFLKTVWVGFLHENTAKASAVGDPMGALLTQTEANIIIQSGSCRALQFLQLQDASSMVFTEKTMALCRSAMGRWRLKRQIKKKHYYSTKAANHVHERAQIQDEDFAFEVICRIYEERKESVRKRSSCIKSVKIMGAIAILGLFMWVLNLWTMDLRKQWDPISPAEIFDKQGGTSVYSCVEVDLLTPLARTEVIGDVQEYYLYGNRDSGTYGVIRFTALYEVFDVLDENGQKAVLSEPLRIYGMTKAIPVCLLHLPKEPPVQVEQVTYPGYTMTLPDGSEVWVPEMVVPDITVTPDVVLDNEISEDYSREAVAFLEEHGIPIGDDWHFGGVLLEGSTEPKRDKAPINSFLDVLCDIMMLSPLLLWPLLVCGAKADREAVIIQRINQGSTAIDIVMDIDWQRQKEQASAIQMEL